MSGPFDESDDEADAAARARGRNDHDSTHVDADARDKIRSVVHRIETLEVDKQAIADDIKAVLVEAKGSGLDTKVIRQVLKRRKMDKAALEELDTMIELYEGVFS